MLSSSGHIAGIVNPPNPKARHWVNDRALPPDAQEWKEQAQLVDGTWWDDWTKWIAAKGGPKVAASSVLGSTGPSALGARPRQLRSRPAMSLSASKAVVTRLVRVGGFDIRMRVRGEGAPLLVINGVGRPLESWEPFSRRLGDRTVISFDAPGVGRSPTPLLPVSISRLSVLAARVLGVAGFKRADVLGFSHAEMS